MADPQCGEGMCTKSSGLVVTRGLGIKGEDDKQKKDTRTSLAQEVERLRSKARSR